MVGSMCYTHTRTLKYICGKVTKTTAKYKHIYKPHTYTYAAHKNQYTKYKNTNKKDQKKTFSCIGKIQIHLL